MPEMQGHLIIALLVVIMADVRKADGQSFPLMTSFVTLVAGVLVVSAVDVFVRSF